MLCGTGTSDYEHRDTDSIGTSKESCYMYISIIEINNKLEVFVQILKTDVGFGNDQDRRPRLLQNPNEVFDIEINTGKDVIV